MILVVGATGTVGGEVMAQLAEAGTARRAMVRDVGRAVTAGLRNEGAELVRGDLDEPASLIAAMEDVDAVLVVTANTPAQVAQETAAIDAAAKAGVDHIVKLSVPGTSADASFDLLRFHYDIEQHLAASGVPHTVVRPIWFMQNLLHVAPALTHEDVLRLPLGDGPIGAVDVRDLAAVIIALLGGDPEVDPVVTGPANVTGAAMAAALAEASGRPIRFEDCSKEDFEAGIRAGGASDWYAREMGTLYDGILRIGFGAGVTDVVERLTGRAPRSISEFASDHAQAFTLEGAASPSS